METLPFTLFSFLVALAILIAVHEFGHFWVARRLGVRILRFSIGFGWPLLQWRGRQGTEYVVAAIPLGGYVKMLDEREGPVKLEEAPFAFNRQPLWKRSAIVAAGPFFNFLLAIGLYWGIGIAGEPGIRPIVGTVAPGSVADRAGFLPGDELLAVGDRPTPTWESANFALLLGSLDGEDLPVRVRDPEGRERVRVLDGATLTTLPEHQDVLAHLGISEAQPVLAPVLGKILPGEPAEQAGLQPGDRILSADGVPVESWREWVEQVQAHPEQLMQIRIERQGEMMQLSLTPRAWEQEGKKIGRIGATVAIPEDFLKDYRVEVRYGPLEALGVALKKTWDLSTLTLRMMGRMLIGQASVEKNLGGPITIAVVAGKTADLGLLPFLKFLALVSIGLGVLNLLPVPVLDGGHLLYFALEGLRGKPLSEPVQTWAQYIGIFLLSALMLLVLRVDIARFFG